jgi:hypothetical protein
MKELLEKDYSDLVDKKILWTNGKYTTVGVVIGIDPWVGVTIKNDIPENLDNGREVEFLSCMKGLTTGRDWDEESFELSFSSYLDKITAGYFDLTKHRKQTIVVSGNQPTASSCAFGR